MHRPVKSLPIGLFDSGVGGLSVLKALIETLPHEDYLYFGDTARLPYGTKSSETVLRYAIENTIALINKDIKLLVVACNTVSAVALQKLQHMFSLPIIGVIQPGVERATLQTKSKHVAVLGTKGTIQSEAYPKALKHVSPELKVTSLACPLFVPLVEEQFLHHPATKLIIQNYLRPLYHQDIDTVLLGCTHYFAMQNLLQEELGEPYHLIDSATACAGAVAKKLEELQLQNHEPSKSQSQFFVSDDPNSFRAFGEKFLGISLPHIETLIP